MNRAGSNFIELLIKNSSLLTRKRLHPEYPVIYTVFATGFLLVFA